MEEAISYKNSVHNYNVHIKSLPFIYIFNINHTAVVFTIFQCLLTSSMCLSNGKTFAVRCMAALELGQCQMMREKYQNIVASGQTQSKYLTVIQ